MKATLLYFWGRLNKWNNTTKGAKQDVIMSAPQKKIHVLLKSSWDENSLWTGMEGIQDQLDICKSPPLWAYGPAFAATQHICYLWFHASLSPSSDLCKRSNICWNLTKVHILERRTHTVGRLARMRRFFFFLKWIENKNSAARMTSPRGVIPWLVTLPVVARVPSGENAKRN